MEKKLLTIDDFSALSADEMFEYTKLVKGNSKTEDFQKATGLDFSYTTFTGLLKKKGIYRSGDTWLRQPAEKVAEKEYVNLADIKPKNKSKRLYGFSDEGYSFLVEYSEKTNLTKEELINLALIRLKRDFKDNKIAIIIDEF